MFRTLLLFASIPTPACGASFKSQLSHITNHILPVIDDNVSVVEAAESVSPSSATHSILSEQTCGVDFTLNVFDDSGSDSDINVPVALQ